MKHYELLINAKDIIGHINPEIYGHFSEHLGRCIYNGIYVGENSSVPNIKGIRADMIEALRNIKIPVLRWPGGCFAEEYHWKDGIGSKESRKKIINTNWGGVTEDNSFGTHEFMLLCELIGCEPYINGNVGSGTVQELSEWIEYMTSSTNSPMTELRKENGKEAPWKVKYLGIGNENWGCGGNMRPEYYAMPVWPEMEPATDFDDAMFYKTVEAANFADELLTRHTEIMNRYDPENKIGMVIGEWGCWHEPEKDTNPGFLYQQNTMRDAIAAAIQLNIFNRHSKRVKMANLAQMVNVLQSVLLSEGDTMVKTPTYHVFDIFKNHQGADAVYCYIQNENMVEGMNTPMISCSASISENQMTITLVNASLSETAEISGQIYGFLPHSASARILSAEAHAFNDFDSPDKVHIISCVVSLKDRIVSITLPPCSIAEIHLT